MSVSVRMMRTVGHEVVMIRRAVKVPVEDPDDLTLDECLSRLKAYRGAARGSAERYAASTPVLVARAIRLGASDEQIADVTA